MTLPVNIDKVFFTHLQPDTARFLST